MSDPKLDLTQLASRHPGLTRALGLCYAEAAAVCFSRHHAPPSNVTISDEESTKSCFANWEQPDQPTLYAWANETDTTEAGAYGVALAAVEINTGLVAVSRAQTLTGADYYVAPAGTDPGDLEECLRLEVSGTDSGNDSVIEARLRAKLRQAAKGSSNLPALASVVGFKALRVVIAKLPDQE